MQLLKKTEGEGFVEYESTISSRAFKSIMYAVSAYFLVLILYVLINGTEQISADPFGILLTAVLALGTLCFAGLTLWAYAIYFSLMRRVRKMGGKISVTTKNNEASYAVASSASWAKIFVPGVHLRWTRTEN